MTDKTGGPAFPINFAWDGIGTAKHLGLTMRDYFAAATLQGLMATIPTEHQCHLTGKIYAPIAYQIADAMLAERDK